jgi:hypothetical protein
VKPKVCLRGYRAQDPKGREASGPASPPARSESAHPRPRRFLNALPCRGPSIDYTYPLLETSRLTVFGAAGGFALSFGWTFVLEDIDIPSPRSYPGVVLFLTRQNKGFLLMARPPQYLHLGLMQPPEAQPPKLLDRVRAAIRTRHYSIRTEEAYVGWIRRFILFHKKRHPAEIVRRRFALYAWGNSMLHSEPSPIWNQMKRMPSLSL